jgi:hypothetical protein
MVVGRRLVVLSDTPGSAFVDADDPFDCPEMSPRSGWHLRLTEARHILLAENVDAASAAYWAEHQSMSQCSRGRARMRVRAT